MKTSLVNCLQKLSLATVLAASGAGLATADTLVGYNFNGLTGSVTDYKDDPPVFAGTGQVAGAEVYVAPNTNDGSDYNSSLLSASNLTRGLNYGNQLQNSGPPNYTGYFSQNSFGIQPVNNVFGTTVSGSISTNNYIQFEVTGLGGSLSLSGVDFGGGSQGNAAGSNLGFAYSTDGGLTFSTAGIPGGDNGIPIADYVSGAGDSGHPYVANVDLSSIAALQNVTGPIFLDFFTLGVGAYQTANFTSNWSGTAADLDDITLLGSFAATPEPSAWAMMLGGMGLLIFWQTRRAKS
jgi:hypothetical protein